MSGYGERLSNKDLLEIRSTLLSACSKNADFKKRVLSEGFTYEAPEDEEDIKSFEDSVAYYIATDNYSSLRGGSWEVKDISISPYLLIPCEGLALSLVYGDVQGDTHRDYDDIIVGMEVDDDGAASLDALLSKPWGNSKEVPVKVAGLRSKMLDIGNGAYIYSIKDTPNGIKMKVSPLSNSQGNMDIAKGLFGETLRAVVDSFGSNVKEVHFVFNGFVDDERCFEGVLYFKNPDGEYSLLIY